MSPPDKKKTDKEKSAKEKGRNSDKSPSNKNETGKETGARGKGRNSDKSGHREPHKAPEVWDRDFDSHNNPFYAPDRKRMRQNTRTNSDTTEDPSSQQHHSTNLNLQASYIPQQETTSAPGSHPCLVTSSYQEVDTQQQQLDSNFAGLEYLNERQYDLSEVNAQAELLNQIMVGDDAREAAMVEEGARQSRREQYTNLSAGGGESSSLEAQEFESDDAVWDSGANPPEPRQHALARPDTFGNDPQAYQHVMNANLAAAQYATNATSFTDREPEHIDDEECGEEEDGGSSGIYKEERREKKHRNKGKGKASHHHQHHERKDHDDDDPGSNGYSRTAISGRQDSSVGSLGYGEGPMDSSEDPFSYTKESTYSLDSGDATDTNATHDAPVYRPMCFLLPNKEYTGIYPGFVDKTYMGRDLISIELVNDLGKLDKARSYSGDWARTSIGYFEAKKEIELDWWDCDANRKRKSRFLIWKTPPQERELPFLVLLGAQRASQ